jgi:hypothetical protein
MRPADDLREGFGDAGGRLVFCALRVNCGARGLRRDAEQQRLARRLGA